MEEDMSDDVATPETVGQIETPPFASAMLELLFQKYEDPTPEDEDDRDEYSDYFVTDGPRGLVYWEDFRQYGFAARYFVLRQEFWSLAVDLKVPSMPDEPYPVSVRAQFIFESDLAEADDDIGHDSTRDISTLEQWEQYLDTDFRALHDTVVAWSMRVKIYPRGDGEM